MNEKQMIKKLMQMNKADLTISNEYTKLCQKSNSMQLSVTKHKAIAKRSKKVYLGKKQVYDNILITHPIKKYRAFREMRSAKKQYKIDVNNYKIAKMNRKIAKKEFDDFRAKVKRQYAAVKQFEKAQKRIPQINNSPYVSLSANSMFAYNSAISQHTSQKWHIDKNPLNNSEIAPMNDALRTEINSAYRTHLKEKHLDKLGRAMDEARYKLKKIGHDLGVENDR